MRSVSKSKPAALAFACVIVLAGCASSPQQPGQESSSIMSAAAPAHSPIPSIPSPRATQTGTSAPPPASESATITVQPDTHDLIPPSSGTIAAGACGRAVGPVAIVVINPDIPAPRCQTVAAFQSLEIINHTDGSGSAGRAAIIRWATYPAVSLEPGQTVMFSGEFGAYLAPGDHVVQISVYAGGGPEIYLRDASHTAGSP